MPNGEDRELARELGAITQHLGAIDGKLAELVTQTKITNGRVNQHDTDIAILKDRESRIDRLKTRVVEVAAAGGVILGSLAALGVHI